MFGLPKRVRHTEVEAGIEVSTVEDFHNGYFDTCIFSDRELAGIDLQRSYRSMTRDGALETHAEQVERVWDSLTKTV